MTAERSTAPVADVEALSRNAGLMTEQFSRALAAYAKPLEDGKPNTALAESVTEVVRTLGTVAEKWFTDPRRRWRPRA